MRAIGYFDSTISSQMNPEEFEEFYQNYCNLYVHMNQGLYIDTNKKYTEKENLFQLIQNSESGYLILVPDSRHISEDLEVLVTTIIKIEESQSSIQCMDEDFPDILQNAFQHTLGSGGSVQKSKNIKTGMQPRAIIGKALGKPPFGYGISDSGEFEIIPSESEVVSKIFSLYVNENMGLRKITQYLNDAKIFTKKGNPWNIVSVREILKNSAYIGTYLRFGLRLPRNHESIISPDIFRKAQDMTRARRSYQAFATNNPYLLSGLCLCSDCNNTMIGSKRVQSWNRSNGDRVSHTYRYYQCQSKNNLNQCGYHTWKSEKLESLVISKLSDLSQSGDLQSSMLGYKGSLKQEEAARQRLSNVEKMEKRFIDFAKKTSQGKSVIARLSLYLDALNSAREQAFFSVSPDQVQSFLNKWDEHDFPQKQSFLKEYVKSIIVKKRSIQINI